MEGPTRRTPSGEDIDGLTGGHDANDSGYFGGVGYFRDFGGYAYANGDRDVAELGGLGDSGYVDVFRDIGDVEKLEAPTTKTSGDQGLAAPTTKTSFGRQRRRREPDPAVPDDLEAPTRKHPTRPKRRRAEPTDSEYPPQRRSAEKAARPAAADETAAAEPEDAAPQQDTAPQQDAALASAGSESTTSSRSDAQPTETGYHRAIGSSRRGIAKWPIAVAAVIALLALGGLGAVWANKALNAQAEAEANSCTEGNRKLRVTTTPTIEDAVTAAAKKWNADKPPVYSHCVTVKVTAKASDEVLPTLRKDNAITVPAAWITPSAVWAEKLAKTNPERVSSTAKPLQNASGTYYTYVVVGGEGVDEIQQRAAQQFRDYVRETVAQ